MHRRPDPLLAAAIVLQWIVTAGVALFATHSGSLFGDREAAERVVANSSSLAHGAVPETSAPGFALLLAPLVRLTDDVDSIASIVTTVNVVVLTPLCAYFLYDIARGAAGRFFAAATMIVWSITPVAATHLYTPVFRGTYVDNVLPALYGLTLRPEFPAMTLAVASAALALRAAAGSGRSALIAGLLAGAAISFTTTAAPVAVAILAAVAVSRRWRALLDAVIGLAAALVPTLVWRHRALGGVSVTAGHPSWSAFEATMAQIREYFWSNRLLQWLPIAGTIGALRLLPGLAVLAATWLAAAAIVIVATPSEFVGGHLLISLIPAWPAYALLVAAIPALVPTFVSRCSEYLTPEPNTAAVPRSIAATAVALLALLPFVLVLLLGR